MPSRILSAILQRLPGVPATVGRRRFERFVGLVPAHVSAVSAQFALNLTVFRFEPPFDRDGLLAPFKQTDMIGWGLHQILLVDHVGKPTRQFHRALADFTAVWLYLNDDEGRGVVLAVSAP